MKYFLLETSSPTPKYARNPSPRWLSHQLPLSVDSRGVVLEGEQRRARRRGVELVDRGLHFFAARARGVGASVGFRNQIQELGFSFGEPAAAPGELGEGEGREEERGGLLGCCGSRGRGRRRRAARGDRLGNFLPRRPNGAASAASNRSTRNRLERARAAAATPAAQNRRHCLDESNWRNGEKLESRKSGAQVCLLPQKNTKSRPHSPIWFKVRESFCSVVNCFCFPFLTAQGTMRGALFA